MNIRIIRTGVFTLILVISAFFICCENDDNEPSGPIEIVVLDMSIETYSEQDYTSTDTSYYHYNDKGWLVKITYEAGDYKAWDTIIYNNNKITNVNRFEEGPEPAETYVFTYEGDNVKTVTETYFETQVLYTYTYEGGKLASFTKTYVVGTIDQGEVESITNIVWEDGNMTSLDVVMHGSSAINASAEYDTYPNPLPPINPDDFIRFFCENNMTKAYVTDTPSEVFEENSYTYEDGRVKTISSTNEGGTWNVKLSYKTITIE